jgi:hypothetical protein
MTHDFGPFRYAFGAHPASYAGAAGHAIVFFGGLLLYLAAPIVLNLLTTRPSMVAIGESIWPADPERRTIVIALVAPVLLAAAGAVLLKIRIGSLWMMSGMTLLPVALLSSPLVSVSRSAAVRLLALAIIYPLVMVAASPGIALVIHFQGVPHYATHYQLIARAMEDAWTERTNNPLRIIGSSTDVVNGIVFYFEGQPSTLDIMTPVQTPWVDEGRIRREGIVIVGPMPESDCVKALDNYAANASSAKIEDVYLARRYFGALDKPVLYRIVTVLPEAP